jgi:hypothetical protein
MLKINRYQIFNFNILFDQIYKKTKVKKKKVLIFCCLLCYTNQAIAMIIDIKDFARMFESLEEYFVRDQIEV